MCDGGMVRYFMGCGTRCKPVETRVYMCKSRWRRVSLTFNVHAAGEWCIWITEKHTHTW